MNDDIKVVKYTKPLHKKIILDMITKDIELYDIEELPFNKENHTRTYTFTKEDIYYETE